MRCRWGLAAMATVVMMMMLPAAARAGGLHFPDTRAIFVPADLPDEIIVTANIGIVRSEDGGKTWTWSCAQAGADEAPAYVLGGAPRHRLFALGGALSYSDLSGCSWQAASGFPGPDGVGRVVVDPTSADRVLAVDSFANDDGGTTSLLVESLNGGASFGAVRYTAPGVVITSVAIAPSDPQELYLTTGTETSLLWSGDGGGSWSVIDLSSALGAGALRVLAVDAFNNGKVFLEHFTQNDEELVVMVAAGGDTVVSRPIAVPFPGSFGGFLQTAAGTLLVSGSEGSNALLYRSVDGGVTFMPVAGAPHIRQMAERNGVLYAATFEGYDGFSEATSADEGLTWQPGMSFTQVKAINPCLKAACQDICNLWVSQALWPAAVCSADLPDAGIDAGSGAGIDAGSGAVDTGADTNHDAAADGPHPRLARSGCRCALDGGHDRQDAALGVLALLSLALASAARSRERRQGRRDRAQ